MDDVTLFTTHCPKCEVLESKLKAKRIQYLVVDNTDDLIALGFTQSPMLKVSDQTLGFTDAIKWVNSQNCEA